MYALRFVVVMSLSSLCIAMESTKKIAGIMKTTSLDRRVMEYPLDNVKAKYCKKYKVGPDTANLYEQEMKRFLIMAALTPGEKHPMYSKKVDKMWHAFILFTQDYATFCDSVIGRFIHHQPTVKEEKESNAPERSARFVKLYTRLFGEQPSFTVWDKAFSAPDCGHSCSIPCDCGTTCTVT